MRPLHIIPALLLALLLSACASLTAPETPAQRLAYADAQFAALVNTAADLREQGVLTADQAEDIDPIIQRGDEALTLAWAAIGRGQPDTALEYVALVNRLLIELRAELQEAQP